MIVKKQEATKPISEIILTKEERSNISDIINNVRYWFMLYRDDKKKLEQDFLLDEINDLNDVKKYINYDQQVGKVKDIFANVKERLTEEEQEKADLLEENALEIMEKLTQGIDYWEDLELRELAEFWMEEAQVHLDAIETSEVWNKRIAKELREIITKKMLMLQKSDKRIDEEVLKNEKLWKELEKKSKMLAKSKKREEELKMQLYLERKPLPPLPKKKNKFKLLGIGKKMKIAFQNLIKNESKNHEFVSKIEVLTK